MLTSLNLGRIYPISMMSNSINWSELHKLFMRTYDTNSATDNNRHWGQGESYGLQVQLPPVALGCARYWPYLCSRLTLTRGRTTPIIGRRRHLRNGGRSGRLNKFRGERNSAWSESYSGRISRSRRFESARSHTGSPVPAVKNSGMVANRGDARTTDAS